MTWGCRGHPRSQDADGVPAASRDTQGCGCTDTTLPLSKMGWKTGIHRCCRRATAASSSWEKMGMGSVGGCSLPKTSSSPSCCDGPAPRPLQPRGREKLNCKNAARHWGLQHGISAPLNFQHFNFISSHRYFPPKKLISGERKWFQAREEQLGGECQVGKGALIQLMAPFRVPGGAWGCFSTSLGVLHPYSCSPTNCI